MAEPAAPGTAPVPATGSIGMDAAGVITVAPNTTPGTYSYDYEICEDLNPTNCATATATIVVDPVLSAGADDYTATPVDGSLGGTLSNILSNDSVNGTNVASDGTETTVTVTADGGLTGVLIADDGTVTVPAGTPADSYTVTYELCLESDPSVCDTADVTIVVAAATLVATDDTPAAIDGALGGSTASVLGNEALPLIRLETPRAFYDYQAKYFSDDTRYHCPSGLPAQAESAFAVLVRTAFDGAHEGRGVHVRGPRTEPDGLVVELEGVVAQGPAEPDQGLS